MCRLNWESNDFCPEQGATSFFFNLSFTFLLPAKTVIQSAAFRSNTLHYFFYYYYLFAFLFVFCLHLWISQGKKTLGPPLRVFFDCFLHYEHFGKSYSLNGRSTAAQMTAASLKKSLKNLTAALFSEPWKSTKTWTPTLTKHTFLFGFFNFTYVPHLSSIVSVYLCLHVHACACNLDHK